MTTDRHDELLELAPSAALGALEAEDLRRFEEHLEAGCPECERELAQALEQLEALAEGLAPVEPSPLTRARLLRQVVRDTRGRGRWTGPVAAVAATAVLAAGLWLHVDLRRQLRNLAAERHETDRQLELVRAELDETRRRLNRTALASRIVAAPGVRSVVLAGLDEAPAARALTYVDPEAGRAVFYAADLPPAGAGLTYQLWFIAAGAPVSAGVFAPDEAGEAMLLVEAIESVERIELWAVTREPEGGVPQPTGPMVLKS